MPPKSKTKSMSGAGGGATAQGVDGKGAKRKIPDQPATNEKEKKGGALGVEKKRKQLVLTSWKSQSQQDEQQPVGLAPFPSAPISQPPFHHSQDEVAAAHHLAESAGERGHEGAFLDDDDDDDVDMPMETDGATGLAELVDQPALTAVLDVVIIDDVDDAELDELDGTGDLSRLGVVLEEQPASMAGDSVPDELISSSEQAFEAAVARVCAKQRDDGPFIQPFGTVEELAEWGGITDRAYIAESGAYSHKADEQVERLADFVVDDAKILLPPCFVPSAADCRPLTETEIRSRIRLLWLLHRDHMLVSVAEWGAIFTGKAVVVAGFPVSGLLTEYISRLLDPEDTRLASSMIYEVAFSRAMGKGRAVFTDILRVPGHHTAWEHGVPEDHEISMAATAQVLTRCGFDYIITSGSPSRNAISAEIDALGPVSSVWEQGSDSMFATRRFAPEGSSHRTIHVPFLSHPHKLILKKVKNVKKLFGEAMAWDDAAQMVLGTDGVLHGTAGVILPLLQKLCGGLGFGMEGSAMVATSCDGEIAMRSLRKKETESKQRLAWSKVPMLAKMWLRLRYGIRNEADFDALNWEPVRPDTPEPRSTPICCVVSAWGVEGGHKRAEWSVEVEALRAAHPTGPLTLSDGFNVPDGYHTQQDAGHKRAERSVEVEVLRVVHPTGPLTLSDGFNVPDGYHTQQDAGAKDWNEEQREKAGAEEGTTKWSHAANTVMPSGNRACVDKGRASAESKADFWWDMLQNDTPRTKEELFGLLAKGNRLDEDGKARVLANPLVSVFMKEMSKLDSAAAKGNDRGLGFTKTSTDESYMKIKCGGKPCCGGVVHTWQVKGVPAPAVSHGRVVPGLRANNVKAHIDCGQYDRGKKRVGRNLKDADVRDVPFDGVPLVN